MDWIYRKKKRNGLSILNFHDDILLKIFTRLSISTILSCRCVCKSWCIFLSSDHFATSYQSNPPFTSIIIQSGKLFALLELKSGNYNYSLKSTKPRILPDPFGLSYCWAGTRTLVGSCNGFFCYSDKDVLYVSNPLSGTGRTHVRLPEKVLDGVSKSSYGFGFCPQTRHYKVIELATYVAHSVAPRTEVHVFTVGIDESWRRIHSPFQYLQQTIDKLCPMILFLEVNGKGALHWIVDDSERLDYLYSFDINEEEVRPIPPPLGLNKRNRSTVLLCMNGCLCLLHINNIEDEMVEFWCMTDYMVQDSWTVRFVLQTSFPRGTLESSQFLPVVVWKNEEILIIIDQGNYIASCDLEQKNVNMLDIALPRSFLDHAAACFVPNFNSYDLITGTAETETKDDAAARKRGLLSQKNSIPTEVANGHASIMDNILSRCREFQEKFLSEKLLSRVPMVGTILCCKGAGKIWSRFLPNPDYKLNNTVHLILCDKTSLRFLSELKSDLFNNVKVCRILATTTTPSMAKITVLGSCNGLVCLSVFTDHHPDHDQTSGAHNICICNPVLQEVAILPQPQGVKLIDDEAYGFGFSSTTGHYKVLRVLKRKWRPGRFEGYVLTIGIDKNWRQVVGGGTFRMPKKWPVRPDNINKSRFCDVPFNNAIHWIAEGDSKLIIYAFDIDEERFNSLSLLPGMYDIKHNYLYPCLGILRDCLCLCVLHIETPGEMELWTMTSYGLATSWTRTRVRIPHLCIRKLPRRVFLPVMSWRDEEILVWVEDGGGTLFSYCLKHNTSVEIKIDIAANNYNEALIVVPMCKLFSPLGMHSKMGIWKSTRWSFKLPLQDWLIDCAMEMSRQVDISLSIFIYLFSVNQD